jgi:hypothetical protein
MKDAVSDTWYHGSPLQLEVLRTGSTITKWRELARVFSHKPQIVSISDDATLQHNGIQPGYLYEVAELVMPNDVDPHPRTTMRPGDEWLTTRDLSLRLLGETQVLPEEFLTESDVLALMQRRKD